MLTKDDIRGVSIMIPTPCIEGGDHWSVTNSVDLEESARMTENIISAGIGVISACGTTGEGHSLLWEEKVAYSVRPKYYQIQSNHFIFSTPKNDKFKKVVGSFFLIISQS